jgi:hypothetical protein
MPHRTVRFALFAVLASPGAALALAAEPVPGSRYAGQTSQGHGFRFEFRTSAGGTSVEKLLAQFKTPKCETSRTGTQGSIRVASIPIAGGRFVKRGKEQARLKPAGKFKGGRQIERYRIAGSFPDGERATGTLEIDVTIRDRSGDVVDSCTVRKPVTWSADRLGVGPETGE